MNDARMLCHKCSASVGSVTVHLMIAVLALFNFLKYNSVVIIYSHTKLLLLGYILIVYGAGKSSTEALRE